MLYFGSFLQLFGRTGVTPIAVLQLVDAGFIINAAGLTFLVLNERVTGGLSLNLAFRRFFTRYASDLLGNLLLFLPSLATSAAFKRFRARCELDNKLSDVMLLPGNL